MVKELNTGYNRPALKWVGNKYSLLDRLLPMIPQDINHYWEPFVGSGAVWWNLKPSKSTLADSNGILIDFYRAVQLDAQRVVELAQAIPNTRESYYDILAVPLHTLELFDRAARFLYLNRTGFRGLWRVNRKGKPNTPYGYYPSVNYGVERLLKFGQQLQTTTLHHADFKTILNLPVDGDFVYLDPPYHVEIGHNQFTQYTGDRFDLQEQEQLVQCCEQLTNRGVRWVQSNSGTNWIREQYRHYHITEVLSKRTISHGKGMENRVVELLIRNY